MNAEESNSITEEYYLNTPKGQNMNTLLLEQPPLINKIKYGKYFDGRRVTLDNILAYNDEEMIVPPEHETKSGTNETLQIDT